MPMKLINKYIIIFVAFFTYCLKNIVFLFLLKTDLTLIQVVQISQNSHNKNGMIIDWNCWGNIFITTENDEDITRWK